jgi:tripartite-type tricarboxylate transporter receptor subunit TctC
VKSGRVNVLGLSTANRVASVPEWPTLSESGVKGFDYTVWTGLFAQKGTPADIVRKLDTDLRAVLAMPEVSKQFEAVGAVVGNETLDAFVQRIKRDTAENEEVVRKADIRAE